MKKIYNLCKNLLPLAAFILCCTSITTFAQNYKVYQGDPESGTLLGTVSSLQAAVDLCPNSYPAISSTIVATENDPDVSNGSTTPVKLPNYRIITLTSEAGEIDTIWQPNNTCHIDFRSGQQSLTLKNIVLSGVGSGSMNGGIWVGLDWGGTITLEAGSVIQECRSGIQVCRSGSVIMKSGSLIQKCSNSGILAERCKIIMESGSVIQECTANRGGGIHADNILLESGSVIRGCTAIKGGGVFASIGIYSCTECMWGVGQFVMQEGTLITNNTADYGGGVYVHEGAFFEMNGGEISGNRANLDGGGIYATPCEHAFYPRSTCGDYNEFSCDYSNPIFGYYNISISGSATVKDNIAGNGGSTPPDNAGDFAIRELSLYDLTTLIHPPFPLSWYPNNILMQFDGTLLNNHQINYRNPNPSSTFEFGCAANGGFITIYDLAPDCEYSIDGITYQSNDGNFQNLPNGTYYIYVRDTITNCDAVSDPIVISCGCIKPAPPILKSRK